MFKGPGPGRPKGSKNRQTLAREAAQWLPRDKVLNSKATPLDIMTMAMHHFADKYHASLLKPGGGDEDALLKAASMAEKAASYVHPRLATNNNIQRNITSISDLSDDELRALGVPSTPLIEGHSTEIEGIGGPEEISGDE